MAFEAFKYLLSPSTVAYSLVYVLLLTGILMYFCENGEEHFNGMKDDQGTKAKLLNRLYFATVTTSTLGYGDITPKSIKARSIVMGFSFLTILFMFSQLKSLSIASYVRHK